MEKHLQSLIEYVSIPSISADSKYKADVERCARWLEAYLQKLGFTVEVVPTKGHPIVYAEKIVSPKAPTVLIYGHYDVQPADPLNLWHTPPFEPTVKDGKLFGRGASDNKGQNFAHIAAVENLGTELAVNVKFVIEGEEEISSANLGPWVRANKKRLQADAIMVSDGAIYGPGKPSLEYGLRGITYMEVLLESAGGDMHSGLFGGVVPNPLNAAAHMIAKLKDEKGKIKIPGFYDKVRKLTKAERDAWSKLGFKESQLKAKLGIKTTPGEPGFSLLERMWGRPTLDVNGIGGGYQGEGSKTVIPAKAFFKFSMRLVPDQDPLEIERLVKAYLKQIVPAGYTMTVLTHGTGKPVITDPNSPPVQAAVKALHQAWGKKPVLKREGGSIPIVAEFQEVLAKPIVMMGMGLSDDNLHAPNEKYDLECFYKGIAASEGFLRLLPGYI